MIKVLSYLKEIKSDVIKSVIFVTASQLSSLSLPLLMSFIINNGIANADMEYIKKIGLLMGFLSAFHVVISGVNSYYTSKASGLYAKSLRERIFSKVETLSRSDIDKVGTASLITRSTSDVKVLQDFVLMSLRMIVAVPIMLLGGTFMAFFLNARLALVIFAIIPIIALIAFIVVKKVIPLFRKRQKLTDEINRFLRQKLSGIRVIRAFNTTEKEDSFFSGKNKELSALVLKFQQIMAVLLPVCTVLIILALDILIYIAVRNIDKMTDAVKIQSTVGDLQAFVIYMIMIIAAVTMAAAMFVIVPRANISAKRIGEILALEPTIRDKEETVSFDENKKGEIEFKNVSFTYGDGKTVLSDISFKAESGKVTALIGPTGSGKSTVINLISRFYDVTDGVILFDGADVRDVRQKELLSKIGYVPQKAWLFSGSIEDNLRYGDENASEERLSLALDISQSSEFVSKMPHGIKSFITQSATNLSGGQKQRLSIARALVRDAEVYIFDDSFSALDFKTDAKLRKALSENIDATVIIVAQRVGTIMNADKILVLDDGKIVGEGSHEELMKSCPAYKEIAVSQLSKEAAI